MAKDSALSPEMEALRMRFQEHSRKAQAYYAVMHEVRPIVGNDDAASAWMDQPLAELGGKTPTQVVNEGNAEDVLAYIGSLSGRAP